MTFVYEVAQNNRISFLDVLFTREGDSFTTSLYRKPTFSELYTNFYSFTSDKYKKGFTFSLLFRIFIFGICFISKLSFLKNKFGKNSYPMHFIDKCTKIFE